MMTYSFIGSDKNAGKTTALNHIYAKLVLEKREAICITSVGINGESVDFFDGKAKPKVTVFPGSLFISAVQNLSEYTGMFSTLHQFSPPFFSKNYLLGKSKLEFELVIEGPNTAREISLVKKKLRELFPEALLLIDGSADRQFLGRPEICDAFYFSLLFTKNMRQVNKARELLLPLSFPVLSGKERERVLRHIHGGVKSLLVSKTGSLLYEGKTIPFMDNALKKAFGKNREKGKYLYLNGALTKSLYSFFAGYENVKIVLDNFTLYQSIHSQPGVSFLPKIYLLNPLFVKEIFLKNETGRPATLPFPENIPVQNLFEQKSESATEQPITTKNLEQWPK
ncbi:MAG: hypothetical protein ACE5FU_02765 [Nitrospinota bacterium]